MSIIDLNCDLGESFGPYSMGHDQEVMAHITSANIACGWHAGDPMVMDRTVALAAGHGVSVGAHPGYPDLLGFGRRHMECAPDELRNYVVYQVGALAAFCRMHGVELSHVKPHGKLYLDCLDREEQARVIAEAVYEYDPGLIYVAFAGARGEVMRKVAQEVGLKVAFEAFPDRAYTPEGKLAPRHLPGAVVTDPARVADIALRVATERKMITTEGTVIDLEAQTLCVHGDTPTALELVKAIRQKLEAGGVTVAPMAKSLQ